MSAYKKRETNPVRGDGHLMYAPPKKRMRFNWQLPNRPIGKCDLLGCAETREYDFRIVRRHSLASCSHSSLVHGSLSTMSGTTM